VSLGLELLKVCSDLAVTAKSNKKNKFGTIGCIVLEEWRMFRFGILASKLSD